MGKLSGGEAAREQQWKAIREVKNVDFGGRDQVPVCVSCFQLHVRCPGPEVGRDGEWDFSQPCLRCEHRGEVLCDFHSERTRV